MATFGNGCPGLVAYIPFLLSVLIFIARYALRPAWRRRPVWLRGFATEEDVNGLRNGRVTPSDGEQGEQAIIEEDIDAEIDAEIDDSDTNAGDSSASSTVVAFGRRSSAVDVRPVGLASSLVSLNIQSWHLLTASLFVLSVSGIAASFILTFAAKLGFLYLTPVAPCVITALLLAIDRPRTVPGTVFVIHSITLTTQTALLFGVPELSQWPGSLTWLAEMSITGLSLAVMMFMPMRDPLIGNGAENDKIATLFETPSLKNRSPEDNLNLYQWMTASWMAPMISLGNARQMNDEDIWHLPFEFQHARLYRLFHDVKGSVTTRIVTVNAPDLIITSLLGIADSVLSMLPIVLLKQMLSSMEGPDAGRRVAAIYAFIICVINILRAQAGIFALWYTRRCYERSRGELITMIYEKTLRRKAFTFPGAPNAEGSKKKGGKRRDSATPKPRILVSRGAPGAAGGGGVRGGGGGMTEIANGAASGSAPASTGKILNLMRNDVYEVSQRFWEFPTLFTKPLNFFLSIYLLWRMLGASALLGIFVIVLAQVINVFVVKYLVRWEMARRAVTDIKLQVTSQFIESIRHLRWYDWQDKWLVNILNARETELSYRVITSMIQRLIFIINQAAAYFFPITAFYMYTVVEGLPLTIDVAFPALNLFNLLEQSLRELPDLITVLLNANVAMRRIEAFMAEPDKEGVDNAEGDVLQQVSEGELVDGIIHPPGPMIMSFEEAAFAWPTAETTILSKVNLTAEGPGLTVIFGKVGTGKTALLMAMLGEMDKHSGTRSVPKETVGYCSQTPWLQSMTVRENILFCLPYDEERYNKVVEACCLLPDFAEFEAGDLSNVGENGIGLSGGQKARVALARAVYSRARILLLDDPIAALDHNTAETIMKRLFSTSGLMSKRLVIFVTHRMDLAADHADQIYEVSDENGVVTKIDVEQVRLSVASPVAGPSSAATALGPVAEETSDAEGSSSQSDSESNQAGAAAVPQDDAAKVAKNKFIEEEHRSHGGVVLSVYWRYVKSGSLWLWSFAVFNFIMFRIAKIGYYYYLKVWGEAYGDISTMEIVSRAVAPLVASASQVVMGSSQGDDGVFSAHSTMEMAAGKSTSGGLLDGQFGLPSPNENVYPWLFWFIMISLFGMFFRSLPEFILIGITYFSGKKVFQEVMIRVSTAPFRFFDVTPVGRLMNRVTSDIGTIDGAVAQQIFRCTWFAFNWLSSILVIATATPTFLVMAVFMTIVFVIIFFKFLPASQSLRRLEMVSLSPLMSNFGTLLEGLTTVRAFRVQPHFQERIIITTDAFQRMDHFYWSLQAWLQWRFNSLSALSTFALTLTALGTGLSSGLIAFVLTAAANFVNATQVLCRRYGELQMQFVSVERVTELLDLDAEPVGTVEPPAAWPTANDDIVFENASFRYAPHLEPSLRNITMRIPAGSTVAVTGRTGSGKSTLALALLGTVLPDADETDAISHGSIYIGAMDIAKVNKHKLRQRISFVAQDPVLFPGSLRENLDPINEYTDAECELVLRRVLSGTSGEFTLESRVDGGGKNMSQGQRQLIGLGRAVLRRSPIVILDEATASIDKKTAFLIQEVLREELRYSTVITIAHRLEAVRDADFSIVLENGRVTHAAPVERSV
ncbi:hypothetical protein F503_05929 [Ophiostoma piceae UAMH 11346]|uniref:Abc transporter n=1 Tax=Ophiostoma piceae (strain UAMH 11346) TaxID=1262450 RepID=S3CBF1_OPHP1|nr:hypothetical protein F503_05929 [Ophiostoma piceae UAMH 11346]